MITHQEVPNCTITVADANNFLTAYGPDVAALKGKTRRGQAPHVPSNQLITIDPTLLSVHRDVTL
eukprot:scaffold26725_cov299-Cylindrotheca_fusiformis.AAC.1